MRAKFVVGCVVAAAGAVVLGASGSSSNSSGSNNTNNAPGVTASSGAHPAANDVSITQCGLDSTTETPQATVHITNHSSSESNYAVTVAFNSSDGKTQYDTGLAAADNLGTGQSTDQTAVSLKSGVPGGFTCKVVNVTRYASNG